MFIHHVYFWLKKDISDAARKQVADDCRTILKDIPGVRHIWAGKPAMTPRDVVDNSYDVGLCVILDDAAGHDVYQDHPRHKEFLTRNKPSFERIRVFDFVE